MALHVAIVSHEYPPYIFGGVAEYVNNLAHSLAREGCRVTVFCGRSKQIVEESTANRLEVVRLPFLDFPPRFTLFQAQNLGFLCKELEKFDILHGQMYSCTLLLCIGKALRKRFVVTHHGVPIRELQAFLTSPPSAWAFSDFTQSVICYPLWYWMTKVEAKLASHSVATGKTLYQDLVSIHGIKNLFFIPNGIDTRELRDFKICEYEKDEGKIKVTFIGRHVWRKGVLHLLCALKILTKAYDHVELHLFGGGPLSRKIAELVREMKLGAYVSLRGWVPRRTLLSEMRSSDIIALPSLYEVGAFIAALEAMALGKAVVAFDYPFTREFISNRVTGMLAEGGNVEDLARCIALLIEDEELRAHLGSNGQQYVQKNHNWSLLVKRYLEIYEQLVERP